MSQTFNFQEFDDDTRDYLLEAREREGRGTPGVFAPVTTSLAGCGCILGPIIIITTLCVTLFTGIIRGDPSAVALLQTAGLLLGGWMLIAAFRVWGSKNSTKVAGQWVYGDPLYLYEAGGEQVKVTPVDEVLEAQYTHNYNNGAYQNSVVRLLMPGNHIVSAQVNHEQRAEQMVVFYNYLAWARGSEGGDRAELAPAVLGGLAKYVAKNDNEPLDAHGNINLNLIELDVGEIPEEPRREGRAMPNFLPYLVMLVGVAVCFFVMKQVNTPMRDTKIYNENTQLPLEPRLLRSYLLDPRNTKHRDDVMRKLSGFYDPLVTHVNAKAQNDKLKSAMVGVIEELRKAEQPIVSIRVRESASPPAGADGAADRAKKIRTYIADTTATEFAKLYPELRPSEPGATFTVPPPPVGHQVIAFVEAPEDASPHFEIDYKFEPGAAGQFKVKYTVTVRTKIDENGVAEVFYLPQQYAAGGADAAATAIGEQVFKDMIGLFGTPVGVGVPGN